MILLCLHQSTFLLIIFFSLMTCLDHNRSRTHKHFKMNSVCLFHLFGSALSLLLITCDVLCCVMCEVLTKVLE